MATVRNVRALRKSMGLTQERFAKRLGVDWRSVHRWEHGDARPSNMAKRRLHELEHEHAHGTPEPSTPRRVRAELPLDAPASPPGVTPFGSDRNG